MKTKTTDTEKMIKMGSIRLHLTEGKLYIFHENIPSLPYTIEILSEKIFSEEENKWVYKKIIFYKTIWSKINQYGNGRFHESVLGINIYLFSSFGQGGETTKYYLASQKGKIISFQGVGVYNSDRFVYKNWIERISRILNCKEI